MEMYLKFLLSFMVFLMGLALAKYENTRFAAILCIAAGLFYITLGCIIFSIG